MVVLAALAAGEQSPSPSDASCRTFVQNFYDWHVAHQTNFETAMRWKRSVLSPQLRDALLEDLAASRKNANETVGLDFDPFVNSQDPAPLYRVGKTTVNAGSCFAEVHGVPSDRKDQPDVTAELRPENGSWRFVNFHYGSDNGAENENLISILRRLKRDREQAKQK